MSATFRRALVFAFVLGQIACTARALEEKPPATPLDELLTVLSLNYFLDNARTSRPDESQEAGTIGRLVTAPVPEVAAGAKAAKPAVLNRKKAVALGEKLNEESKARRGSGPSLGDVAGLALGPSDRQLAEAERAGVEGASKLLEERAARGQRVMEGFANSLRETLLRSAPVINEQFDLRKRAEEIEAEAVSDQLRPALRARAGAQTTSPPIKLTFGFQDKRHSEIGPGLLSLTALAPTEITRLTVLLAVESPRYKRLACLYIPKLGVSSRCRSEPIVMLWAPEPRAGAAAGQPSEPRARYSAWSDQFQTEDIELPVLPGKEAELEYRLQAAAPGATFVKELGWGVNARKGERRFALKFKTLSPLKDTYSIEAELSLPDEKPRPGVTTSRVYKGTLQPEAHLNRGGLFKPMPLMSDDPVFAIPMRSRTDAFTLVLGYTDDGEFWWHAQDNRAYDGSFIPLALDLDQRQKREAWLKAHPPAADPVPAPQGEDRGKVKSRRGGGAVPFPSQPRQTTRMRGRR